MRQKLGLITLAVRDFKRSNDFFENGLGWKRSPASMDDISFFPLGGMILSLYPRQSLADDATVSEEGSGFQGFTIAYLAKSEKEVDEVLEKVRSLGARIVKPAARVFWGGYSGYFADFDDHLFEVAFNPFWPLNENEDAILP